MKFIFADALDMIDPAYDFLSDQPSATRSPYWSDKYAHEFFAKPPYDGVLISKGIVGDHRLPGKYTRSQSMRFRRVGARDFLRLTAPQHRDLAIFGDCGAFTFAAASNPPFSIDELLNFYADGRFTHGCSLDHVIFDFDPQIIDGLSGGSPDAKRRYEITLDNAKSFLKRSRDLGRGFTPLGVIQGWSPGSMARAARALERMGYSYLAVGGMVMMSAEAIHLCLKAIRRAIQPRTRLHLLGFAKAEQISEFTNYGIASFDSTSPLLRAFKDAKANYYVSGSRATSLDYYTAIRVPQALENRRLKTRAREGRASQEQLTKLEARALETVRAYDKGRRPLKAAVEAVVEYNREFLWDPKASKEANEKKVLKQAEGLHRTLADRPWERCKCRVCREAGIEVMIFRSSNRNKRRGFHNLYVYYDHLGRALR